MPLTKILSRVKPAVGGEVSVNKKAKGKKSTLVEDHLAQRDYLGAITLLEVMTPFDCSASWTGVCDL